MSTVGTVSTGGTVGNVSMHYHLHTLQYIHRFEILFIIHATGNLAFVSSYLNIIYNANFHACTFHSFQNSVYVPYM